MSTIPVLPNPIDDNPVPGVNITGLLDELDVPVPQPARTGAQPTAQPTTTEVEGVPGADGWTPEERNYLREMMHRQITFDQNRETVRQFCEKHRAEYLPNPQNADILQQIIRQGTNDPSFDFTTSDYDGEVLERAFHAAIANDLLELPPAQSLSEAQLADRRISTIKQAFSRETSSEPAPRTVRTAVFESGTEPPASTTTGQRSNNEIAYDISKMGIDAARRHMEQLMRAARTNPSY
jgi:hypothetical protein